MKLYVNNHRRNSTAKPWKTGSEVKKKTKNNCKGVIIFKIIESYKIKKCKRRKKPRRKSGSENKSTQTDPQLNPGEIGRSYYSMLFTIKYQKQSWLQTNQNKVQNYCTSTNDIDINSNTNRVFCWVCCEIAEYFITESEEYIIAFSEKNFTVHIIHARFPYEKVTSNQCFPWTKGIYKLTRNDQFISYSNFQELTFYDIPSCRIKTQIKLMHYIAVIYEIRHDLVWISSWNSHISLINITNNYAIEQQTLILFNPTAISTPLFHVVDKQTVLMLSDCLIHLWNYNSINAPIVKQVSNKRYIQGIQTLRKRRQFILTSINEIFILSYNNLNRSLNIENANWNIKDGELITGVIIYKKCKIIYSTTLGRICWFDMNLKQSEWNIQYKHEEIWIMKMKNSEKILVISEDSYLSVFNLQRIQDESVVWWGKRDIYKVNSFANDSVWACCEDGNLNIMYISN